MRTFMRQTFKVNDDYRVVSDLFGVFRDGPSLQACWREEPLAAKSLQTTCLPSPTEESNQTHEHQQAGTWLGHCGIEMERQILRELADAVRTRNAARGTVDPVDVELRRHIGLEYVGHHNPHRSVRTDSHVSADGVVLEVPNRLIGANNAFDELAGRNIGRGERVFNRVVAIVPAPLRDRERARSEDCNGSNVGIDRVYHRPLPRSSANRPCL